MLKRRPWREELEIIDRTMKSISGVTEPEKFVELYWGGIGELLAIENFVAVSRRNIEAPYFLVTRSSRFTEHFNPWTEREKLPKLSGGLLGELAYGNGPRVIEDLPSVLGDDDPAHFYLQGFGTLICLPQYDGGEALNTTVFLLPIGVELDLSMVPILHWQGGLFGRGTQGLVLRKQLSEALHSLDRELQIVGNIQRSLLPSKLPIVPGFEFAADYETSARAGGDYYDFFPLDKGRWGLFIADVSGHGTPAAVLMAITHAIAHSQPGAHTPPGALLEYLNNELARAYTLDGTFVTAFYAILDPSNGKLTYSSAGHNPPRLARENRMHSLNDSGSLPLGIVEGQSYGQSETVLEPGDMLLLYTDGITEAMAPAVEGHQELFGLDRLDSILLECGSRSAAGCLERISEGLKQFCNGAPATDDRTLIAVRVQGGLGCS